MSKFPKLEIEKDILVGARQTSGFDLDTAARKIGITPVRLEEWEKSKPGSTIK
jgi:hypothetical protein